MTFRLIIEPTAERGIREAIRWITQQASPTVAAKWYNGLIRKTETLKAHPMRCPLAAENDKFPEEIRELLYGRQKNKYRLIFTIAGDAVHLLYVRHSARDDLEP